MSDEALTYFNLSLTKYRGTFTEARDIVITVPAARQLAAEMCFIYEHGRVPEWAVYIKAFVKKSDGGYIFEHHPERHPQPFKD